MSGISAELQSILGHVAQVKESKKKKGKKKGVSRYKCMYCPTAVPRDNMLCKTCHAEEQAINEIQAGKY